VGGLQPAALASARLPQQDTARSSGTEVPRRLKPAPPLRAESQGAVLFTMTFSPQLEAKFAKLLTSYPPGGQRSAMVPMLLFAQDEVGAVDARGVRGDRPPHRCVSAAKWKRC